MSTATEHSFTIATDSFEGPLDLLLSLIRERKLLINDVSLARVAESYFDHLKERGESVEEISEFLVVASTLVLIKSKSLLPSISYTEEEEESVADLRVRLTLFEHMNRLALLLTEEQGRMYSISYKQDKNEVRFTPSADITVDELQTARDELILRLPKKEKKPEVSVKKTVSLEEVILKVERHIQETWSTSFDTLVSSKEEKVTHIIHFLAVLELAKQGLVALTQSERFGTIHIENESLSTPAYGTK